MKNPLARSAKLPCTSRLTALSFVRKAGSPAGALLLTVFRYLSDAAHRRFIATLVALIATHLLGKALDADQLALYLEIGIGGLSGAWSSCTPKLSGENAG